ncbi:MAG: sporulation protein YqfD [Clostridiales bacterium]|nr:sporulation protein YqfD [Clostridiales bacterium]
MRESINKYMKGYLTIKVEGLDIERFLNMSVTNKIYLWDIKRISFTEVLMKINIKGYRSLKRISRKTGCRISIVEKKGFPFFLSRLGKRKMMAAGFLIFVALIIWLSSFIWSVRITGVEGIRTQDVTQNLSALGVRPGAPKLNIAVADVENNMLIRMSSLSWIKIKLIGTRAEVQVKEKVPAPEMVPVDKPCNIVAKRDGIIEKIASTNGDVVVSQGDPVRKGQLLVTGAIDRENAGRRYVHASAEILARTWYDGSAAVPLKSQKNIRTGRKAQSIYIISGSKKYMLKKLNIPYKSYDKIERSTGLIDTDVFQLPVRIVIEDYYETIAKNMAITKEEAQKQALGIAEKSILDNISKSAKIIDKKVSATIKEGVAVANVTIETMEDIGASEEIK